MLIKESVAAILVETSKPLLIENVSLPECLDVGQVLVRLITSGICGAQINEIDAVKGPDHYLPHLLGHEGFAEIIEVGPGVKKVNVGDFVILHWRPSSGIQSNTPKYRFGNRVVNAGWVTTFNEYAVVSENRITRVSKDSDPVIAPLLGCALTTALGVLENDAQISHRDVLLIVGFGGVGMAVLQFAQYLGVRKVIVLDKDASKRDLALKLGASQFISSDNKEDAKGQLQGIVNYSGFPTVAIETTGNSGLIELAYEVTTETGKVVLVGVPRVGDMASIYTLPLHFGKILTGSKGGGSNPEVDIPFINKLMDEGRISLDNFPVQRFQFKDINLAIESLKFGIHGRIVLEF